MKKKSKNRRPVAAGSQVALSAAIVALPFTLVSPLHGQVRETSDQPKPADAGARRVSSSLSRDLCCLKFAGRYHKDGTNYTIVGIENKQTVYRNARNEYFYLDPATGDMKFVAPEPYMKQGERATRLPSRATLKASDPVAWKYAGAVSILGVDQAGHVIHQNDRGETFYLDPNTGDMVFSK